MQELLEALVLGWLARKQHKEELVNRELRNKVSNEIIETEKFYIQNIEAIVKPMRSVFPAIVSEETANLIFSNVEDILIINQQLLASLTADDSPKMGQTFLKLAPVLKLYSAYCKDYPTAITKLSRKMQEDRFNAFLKKAKDEHRSQLDLPSLLIMPVQRIPRYKLLLTELLKRTAPEHEDYNFLQEALEKVSEVAAYINESIRERQNLEKILAIQRKFTGSVPPLVVPRRAFIREGSLTKVCRKVVKKRFFVLFSDAMIYGGVMETVGRYKFHRIMSLLNAKVKDVPDKPTIKNAFQIIAKEKSFTVFADTPKDKKSWVDSLEHVLRLLSMHGKSYANLTRPESSMLNLNESLEDEEEDDGSAPVWIPDGEAGTCMICSTKFTTFKRRHHCRKCGKVVCGKCSSFNFKLDNLQKQARVCGDCFKELSQNSSSAANGSNENEAPDFIDSLEFNNSSDITTLPEGTTGVLFLTKIAPQNRLRFDDETQMMPKTAKAQREDLFSQPLPPLPPVPAVPPPSLANPVSRISRLPSRSHSGAITATPGLREHAQLRDHLRDTVSTSNLQAEWA